MEVAADIEIAGKHRDIGDGHGKEKRDDHSQDPGEVKVNAADHEQGDVTEEDQVDHAAHTGGLKDILDRGIGERLRNGIGIDKDQDQRDDAGDPGRIVIGERLRLSDGIAELFEDRVAEIVDDQTFHGAHKSRSDNVHAAEIVKGQNAGRGIDACLCQHCVHSLLHCHDIGIEVKTGKSSQRHSTQKLHGGGEDHHQNERAVHIPARFDAGSVNHADKGHAHRVKHAGECAEEKRDQDRADKDRQAVFPPVFGGEGHHGDGKNEHKETLEHSACLPVEQKQNAEDSNDHSSKS